MKCSHCCYVLFSNLKKIKFSKIYYHISFKDPTMVVVSFPSHNFVVRHIVIPDCRNLKTGAQNGVQLKAKFHENRSANSEYEASAFHTL